MKAFLCDRLEWKDRESPVKIFCAGREFIIENPTSYETKVDALESWPPGYPNEMLASSLSDKRSVGGLYCNIIGAEEIYSISKDNRKLVLEKELGKLARYQFGNHLVYYPEQKRGKKESYTTRIWDLLTKSERVLPWQFDHYCTGDNQDWILCHRPDLKSGEDVVVKLDLSRLEINWENSNIKYPEKVEGNKHFFAEIKETNGAGLFSLETGEMIKEFSHYPTERSGSEEILDSAGYLRRMFFKPCILWSYDLESQQETVVDELGGLSLKNADLQLAGDELVVHHVDQKRLRTYRVPSLERLTDHRFEMPIPADDYIRKTDGGYVYFTNKVESEHDPSHQWRACFFTLDELEQDEVSVELELPRCSHGRIERSDGDVDYRVSFPESESLGTLYRHIASYTENLGVAHGMLHGEPGETTDEDWTGLIEVDLRNQTLDKQAQLEIRTACMYIDQRFMRHDARTTSGVDAESNINVRPIFADE